MKCKLVSIVLILGFFLTGCNHTPSVSVIQTAIAETQLSLPTNTQIVSSTLAPTYTPVPESTKPPTNTPGPTKTLKPTLTKMPSITPDAQKTADSILIDVAKILEDYADSVELVQMIRPGTDSLEIELKTIWASKDRQPIVSYEVIQILSQVFADSPESNALNFVTGNPEHFSIMLTTYSTNGTYRYKSLTYYETLVKVLKKQITYDEWVSEAAAGFK